MAFSSVNLGSSYSWAAQRILDYTPRLLRSIMLALSHQGSELKRHGAKQSEHEDVEDHIVHVILDVYVAIVVSRYHIQTPFPTHVQANQYVHPVSSIHV